MQDGKCSVYLAYKITGVPTSTLELVMSGHSEWRTSDLVRACYNQLIGEGLLQFLHSKNLYTLHIAYDAGYKNIVHEVITHIHIFG